MLELAGEFVRGTVITHAGFGSPISPSHRHSLALARLLGVRPDPSRRGGGDL